MGSLRLSCDLAESEEEAKDFLKTALLNYPDFKINGAHIVKLIRYYDGGYVSGTKAMELMMEELNEQAPHILDDTGKSMILRKITAEQSSSLEAFTGNLSRRGFIEQLKAMMSEFLQY